MRLNAKSILVTGGSGFIGSHLVDYLIEKNPSQLVVVDNFFLGKNTVRNLFKAKERFPELSIINHSAADLYEMGRIIDEHDIDVVFNFAVVPLVASLLKPAWCAEENIGITLCLCELLKDGRYENLYHCSSSEAYGTLLKYPMREDHPLMGTTPYAASKSACDVLALSYWRTYDVLVSILRPFNTYGPRQNEGTYAGVVPITIKNVLLGKQPQIHGTGEQTRDYIYVEDTAKLCLDVVETGKAVGQVVNIAVGEEIIVRQIIETIINELGYEGEIKYMPRRIGDVNRHCADISLLKSLVGNLTFTPFKEGIHKTVEWFRKHFEEYKLNQFFDAEEFFDKRLSIFELADK